jgi:hypothetical protein
LQAMWVWHSIASKVSTPAMASTTVRAGSELKLARTMEKQPHASLKRASPKSDFVEPVQRDLPCPVLRSKIFRLRRRANQKYKPRRLIPHEGRWPSSRTLGWDAVDAAASGAQAGRRAVLRERSLRAGRTMLLPTSSMLRRACTAIEASDEGGSRTAKPCGPGTRCWCQIGGGFRQPNRV